MAWMARSLADASGFPPMELSASKSQFLEEIPVIFDLFDFNWYFGGPSFQKPGGKGRTWNYMQVVQPPDTELMETSI